MNDKDECEELHTTQEVRCKSYWVNYPTKCFTGITKDEFLTKGGDLTPQESANYYETEKILFISGVGLLIYLLTSNTKKASTEAV